jgi:hypothetical protein
VQIGQRNPGRAARLLVSLVDFPQPAHSKVFIMRQTQVAAPAFSPVPVPTLTGAAIRFVVSLGALVGISLLLASL